jgi:hypothetical protein
MEDKALPKSYGEEAPSPTPFPERDELCKRLDAFYEASGDGTSRTLIKRDFIPI